MSEIRTSKNGKMLKSELLTVWISARSVFERSGLQNFWAQIERLVTNIKTQMTKNLTTFYGHLDFRCSKMSKIQTKLFGFWVWNWAKRRFSEIRTSSVFWTLTVYFWGWIKVNYNGRLSQMDFVYKFFEKPVMSSLAGWLDNTVREVDHIC